MRTFGTIVLGLLFVLAFDACSLVHTVGGYLLDAGAVTGTMRKVDMYEGVMEGLDLAFVESAEKLKHPELAKDVTIGARDALKQSMTKAWFYSTFEKTYGGFVAYLEGAKRDVEVDLSDQKRSLDAYLGKIAHKHGAREPTATATLVEALNVIPERTTVTALLKDSGRVDDADLKRARDAISTIHTIRFVTLIIALLLLGLIALVAMKTTRRLLISMGAVLLLSALCYFGAASVARHVIWAEVEDRLDEPTQDNRIEKLATQRTTKLVKVALSDAFARSNLPVGGVAALGALLIGVGLVVVRARHGTLQGR